MNREDIAERVNLFGVPTGQEASAINALFKRDVVGFLIQGDNLLGLDRVFLNLALLKELGIYESTLLHAYISTRTNNYGFSLSSLIFLFRLADRGRLRACGDPVPHAGLITLYRGVAGRGAARRVRGLSWTGKIEKAIWFANRAASMGLQDAAVYEATVPIDCILAYTNSRDEDEYLVALSPSIKTRKLARAEWIDRQ